MLYYYCQDIDDPKLNTYVILAFNEGFVSYCDNGGINLINLIFHFSIFLITAQG